MSEGEREEERQTETEREREEMPVCRVAWVDCGEREERTDFVPDPGRATVEMTVVSRGGGRVCCD